MAENSQKVKKRKKTSGGSGDSKPRKKQFASLATTQDLSDKIEQLEAQILDSQKNYNSINELLGYTGEAETSATRRKAKLALCTIFSHLLSEGKLSLEGKSTSQENIVSRWLLKRYEQYFDSLLASFFKDSELASRLLMQLVKQEASSATSNQIWIDGLYSKLIKHLLDLDQGNASSFEHFTNEHILPYKDTRMYACKVISTHTFTNSSAIDQTISFLTSMPLPQKDDDTLNACLATYPPHSKRKAPSDTIYKKTTEEAWLSILRSSPSAGQRKRLLDLIANSIAPWFARPELLTDFLTDSFDAGGVLSLTALSGMFYLIQQRNLDYPQFYTKVYSLIDSHILHSKQRSRFLRLMIIFLASTHLPAALVASFMKRLSRLCLFAPPAAIIAIVPWLYNMIQEHPVCAFMIQRSIPAGSSSSSSTSSSQSAKSKTTQVLIGEDPFDFSQADPMLTNALESSLWEIDTLATHYHPNVATIASILSKHFTKQAYKVEDFLDYTYDGMLEAELGRNLKKAPVVEFQIPKRIFLRDPDEHDQNGDGTTDLLRRLWTFE